MAPHSPDHTETTQRTADETEQPRSKRLSGTELAALEKKVVQQYNEGASIRQVAAATSRSYGGTHRMLKLAGVTMRPRGGRHSPEPTS
ncbi:hypothetical protein SAMN06264365_103432 [Actinoplanes regularis]|uniref:Helix-turn-helix domain-containing protein n=2 Tax=Actinoplanes regularis TaxID=52697 RepID=A0A238XI62_9ACTN|nr:hypothetical protein Are01nite_32850 [Actinoplanes regularis]SNR58014.1 hypothetical protein SAMN06264365_103432 [Actinoplanes regularis]